MNVTQYDRKQVFGVEELTPVYLEHIRSLLDDKIRSMTTSANNRCATIPLTNWVN